MEDEGKQEEKFEFTSEGEDLGHISLDGTRVLSIEYASSQLDFYGSQYGGIRLVWEVVNSEDRENHYERTLSFRPTGRFQGEPGHEQLIFDKPGDLRVRQLLDEPLAAGQPSATPAAEAYGLCVSGQGLRRINNPDPVHTHISRHHQHPYRGRDAPGWNRDSPGVHP